MWWSFLWCVAPLLFSVFYFVHSRACEAFAQQRRQECARERLSVLSAYAAREGMRAAWNMWNWDCIEGKFKARERETTNERERNIREKIIKWMCCCWRLLLLYYCECGVLEKYWCFSDFIFKLYYSYAFYTFGKTYNKNTFLLRWFIAFICLNGRWFLDETVSLHIGGCSLIYVTLIIEDWLGLKLSIKKLSENPIKNNFLTWRDVLWI